MTPTPPISSEMNAMKIIAPGDPVGDALEALDHLVGRQDVEVVLGVEGHVAAGAQQRPPLLDDDRNLVRPVRHGRDVDRVAAADS